MILLRCRVFDLIILIVINHRMHLRYSGTDWTISTGENKEITMNSVLTWIRWTKERLPGCFRGHSRAIRRNSSEGNRKGTFLRWMFISNGFNNQTIDGYCNQRYKEPTEVSTPQSIRSCASRQSSFRKWDQKWNRYGDIATNEKEGQISILWRIFCHNWQTHRRRRFCEGSYTLSISYLLIQC